MPACHAGGQGFEPPSDRHFFNSIFAGVAQLAEQLICNQQVAGSSPFASSIFINMGRFPSGQREQTVNLPSQTSVVRIHPHPPLYAGMAELADAHGSGPCAGDSMQVQVLFPAPIKELKISSFLIMFWRLQKQRPLLFYYFTVSINLRAISQSAFLTYTRYSYAEFESINGVPCILPEFVIVLVFTVYSIFFSVKTPSTRFKYSKLLVTQISFRLSVNIVNTPWSLHYIQSTSILK